MCGASQKLALCLRRLREDGEGVLLLACTGMFPARHSAPAVQRKICAWAFSGKQQKMLSVSFSWKVVPGVAALESEVGI